MNRTVFFAATLAAATPTASRRMSEVRPSAYSLRAACSRSWRASAAATASATAIGTAGVWNSRVSLVAPGSMTGSDSSWLSNVFSWESRMVCFVR